MIIQNIEHKIKLATWLCAGSLLASITIVGMVSFFAWKQVANSQKNIYVLDVNQVPLAAKQTDIQMNRPAEYRSHINLFHSLFFTLMPDEKFIERQLREAMYLIDESGAKQYNDLKEKGFFNSILSASATLTLQTDSIVIDPVKKHFVFYGKQKINRRSSEIIRSLITEGNLKDLNVRTENNAHAVLITGWKTIQNKDLSYVEKNSL